VVDYRFFAHVLPPQGTAIIVGRHFPVCFSWCFACRLSHPPQSRNGLRPNGYRRCRARRCGPPRSQSRSVSLQHKDGGTALNHCLGQRWKVSFLSGVEGGAYTLGVEAAGYFKATYEFVLRPRQPISLNVDLQEKQTVRESGRGAVPTTLTVDPEKTGSSYTFTRQDLERAA